MENATENSIVQEETKTGQSKIVKYIIIIAAIVLVIFLAKKFIFKS